MTTPRIVSHHMLRRRARNHAHHLQREDPAHTYHVTRAQRGPWRWRVTRT